MNYKATIKKGEPMPSICTICSSIYKCKGEKSEVPQENACFVDYFEERELKIDDEKIREKLMAYAPFTNSKRTVRKTCGNFAHIKSYRMW